jgi:hypothetical protein
MAEIQLALPWFEPTETPDDRARRIRVASAHPIDLIKR